MPLLQFYESNLHENGMRGEDGSGEKEREHKLRFNCVKKGNLELGRILAFGFKSFVQKKLSVGNYYHYRRLCIGADNQRYYIRACHVSSRYVCRFFSLLALPRTAHAGKKHISERSCTANFLYGGTRRR